MKKFVIGCMVIVVGLMAGMYFRESVAVSSGEVDTNPVATVLLSTGDTFKMVLYPEEAPNTVNNFLYLAGIGFYDGTTVNRIVPDYLIQLGDPIGNGKGFPGYFIKSECRYNGTSNKISHTKGTVSMARSGQFNTEGSQFFITLEDASHLNGQYSAFGTIIEGMDVLELLSAQEVNSNERPVEDLRIEAVTIETFGQSYSEPEVLSVQEVLALYE